MSVALNASPPALARNNTLDNIGIVVRRSTTLCTWLSVFRRAARSMVSFMIATRRLTGRRRPTPSPRGLRKGPPQSPHPPGAGRRDHSVAPNNDVLSECRIGEREFFDFAHCMHDRGVIATTEFLADLRQRARRQLLGEIHCDLARPRDGTSPALGGHLAQTDVEMLGDAPLDFVDGYPPLTEAQQVAQQLLCALQRDLAPDQLHICNDAIERALEFSDVRSDLVSEKLHHLTRDPYATLLDLRFQDAQTQLVRGRMQIGDKPPTEPGAHAFFESFEVGRRLVSRNHDLAILIDQCIKGVKELLLSRLLPADELDIVDHQQID